ncbi:GIY-YIG nuclease family protein [Candidatus Uhrbacteria bacterium]|nr:GIY-YIG nuclease family protein [Candidatus Uhrbacteria bacterium]
MNEIIYILINESMPGYVKIGQTSDLDGRIKTLYQGITGIPLPFECFYAARVRNMKEVEDALHEAFGDYRVNPNREFFTIAPEKVRAVLKVMALEDVTPRKIFVEKKEERVALDKARKNRERFNFNMVKIPIGAELYFSRDENKKAKVIDNRSIMFNGDAVSLSTSAQKILGVDYGVAGTDYWMYEDETLDERRRRFESGE